MKTDIHTSCDLSGLRGPAIASLNIRSVTNKIDDVKILLARSQLNCLVLTESWLNDSIGDDELEISNYRFIRRDRDAGCHKRGGGGVLIRQQQ